MNNFIETIKLCLKAQNTKVEEEIGRILTKNSTTVSTTESCTGGLVSSRLTDIAGSSAYIKENYVTYANEAKMKLLHVSEETLKNHGAVSEECAREMAEGLFQATGCDFALATTGIAGPGGATATKNVGLMYIGLKDKDTTKVIKVELNPKNSRKMMKFQFSQVALENLLQFLNSNNLKI